MRESVNKYLEDIRTKAPTIMLDKERHIVFDLNAFADLEEEYESIDKAFEALLGGSVKAIRKLLHIGLRHEDEELTEREVGKIFTLDRTAEISDLIMKAMGAGLPNEEGPVEAVQKETAKKK